MIGGYLFDLVAVSGHSSRSDCCQTSGPPADTSAVFRMQKTAAHYCHCPAETAIYTDRRACRTGIATASSCSQAFCWRCTRQQYRATDLGGFRFALAAENIHAALNISAQLQFYRLDSLREPAAQVESGLKTKLHGTCSHSLETTKTHQPYCALEFSFVFTQRLGGAE